MIETLFGLVLFVLAVLLYFAPWLVAKGNKSSHQEAIFVVNFFLGWTVIGWIVALAWACIPTKSGK